MAERGMSEHNAVVHGCTRNKTCVWQSDTGLHVDGTPCKYGMRSLGKVGDESMNDEFELSADSFKLIKDMDKGQIVQEIIENFRVDIKDRDIRELREILVKIRVTNYKERTLKEAGLKEKAGGILGIQYVADDDDD